MTFGNFPFYSETYTHSTQHTQFDISNSIRLNATIGARWSLNWVMLHSFIHSLSSSSPYCVHFIRWTVYHIRIDLLSAYSLYNLQCRSTCVQYTTCIDCTKCKCIGIYYRFDLFIYQIELCTIRLLLSKTKWKESPNRRHTFDAQRQILSEWKTSVTCDGQWDINVQHAFYWFLSHFAFAVFTKAVNAKQGKQNERMVHAISYCKCHGDCAWYIIIFCRLLILFIYCLYRV